MEKLYFAKWVLLENGEILENGAIQVTQGRISAIGPRGKISRSSTSRIVNLGDMLLIPGCINLHTHLEESVFRESYKEPQETFAAWTTKKNARLKQLAPSTIEASIRLSIREIIATGTTTICDSSRLGISPKILANEPLRAWVINELYPETISQEESHIESCKEKIRSNSTPVNWGIGPYAIYSLSPISQRALIQFSQEQHCLWGTHIAESSEELQAFAEHQGDLYFQITRKKPWMFGEKTPGSLYYAITSNLIPPHGICFHCNYATGNELALLMAKRVSVVICFQYSQLMEHKFIPLDIALNRGVNICVGTESILSHGMDSLFDELFALKNAYPHIPAKTMIQWITRNPAIALRMYDSLGSLSVGKMADIVGVRFNHDTNEDLLEEMIMADPEIAFVMINGEEIIENY